MLFNHLSQFRSSRFSLFSFISIVVLTFILTFTTKAYSAQVTLAWDANTESDLAGYKIYYGNSSGNYGSNVDVANQTSYTISNLVDGNTYFIAATAYDINGNESSYSNEVSYEVPIIDTTPPSNQVTLAWDANTENDLAGYKVYYGNSSGIYSSNVDVGNQTSYTITNLVNGNTYFIAATAYDINGNESSYSNEVSYSVPDTTLPSTPASLQATAISTSQIDLTWNASTDNIGVVGYRIFRDGIQITNTANTTYQNTGLSPSTTYTYTVSAYDAAGNESGQSTGIAATTLSLPVNNSPVLSPIGNKSVNEGQTLSFAISATDLDSDTLNYTASNLPSGAIFNVSTQTFSWTTTYNQAGTYSNITFQVSDGKDIDSESITITVVNVNRPPVLATISPITVNEGNTITIAPTATDPDAGDTLAYTYSGWMISNTYTTNYDDVGTHAVTVTVSDGSLTDSQVVTITVVNLNRAPVLDPIADITVNEGDTITLNPTAADPDGDSLTYTYSGWMSSANYTTNYDDAGTYTVTVTASDGSLTDSQVVTIIVNDVDNIPPTITSVSASSSTQVIVVFSEPVEEVSATNVLNYSIDNSITVLSASLGSDLQTATLTTSEHTDGITYVLTVNNIRDMSSSNNMIASNITVSYTFVTQLVINNLTLDSNLAYEIVYNGLQNGELVYIDRSFTYSTVPTSLGGATYIKTANDDEGSSAATFLTFDVNLDVTVYVAHDDRITTKPSWLTSFTGTGNDLVTTDTTLSLFASNYLAGTITLGDNEGNGNGSMYTVVIVKQITAPITDTSAPDGSVSINNGSASTNSTSVTLKLSATDDVAVTGFYVSVGSSAPSASSPDWQSDFQPLITVLMFPIL